MESKIADRFLSLLDEEFVKNVEQDIREFVKRDNSNSVLLFPPVNNYRRFLIHKVCEEIATQYDIVTFSVGQGVTRRTVVCYKNQLLLPLEELSADKKRKEEKPRTWRSGHFTDSSVKKSSVKMGVERNSGEGTSSKSSKTVDIYRPPALRNHQPSNLTSLRLVGDLESAESSTKSESSSDSKNVTANVKLESTSNQIERAVRRERRPDRAVYVPRARRSLTKSPNVNPVKPKSTETMQSSTRSETPYKEIAKGNFNENEERSSNKGIVPVIPNCDNQNNDASVKLNSPRSMEYSNESDKQCDSKIQNDIKKIDSTNIMNKTMKASDDNKWKDSSQLDPASNHKKMSLIETATPSIKKSEDEREIDELERMSREINRSSRRIVKQTFNSDILEIPDNLLPINSQQLKAVDPENDDWDSIFDDNGDCVDPKIISELTASVGKVKIEQPKADYKAYLMKQAILNEEEYPHVLEVSNFPVEFKTHDIMMVFSAYKESGFDIKWVDDTHALAVFSSSRIAAEALAMSHPFVLLKPLADATVESRAKARKCAASLQPYRPRPETCAALARRLVTGALGVRLKTATEERENEKKVLREAKERKLLAAKQRDEAWES